MVSKTATKGQQTYQELLNSIRQVAASILRIQRSTHSVLPPCSDILRAKYSQKPQLSSSHPMVRHLQLADLNDHAK